MIVPCLNHWYLYYLYFEMSWGFLNLEMEGNKKRRLKDKSSLEKPLCSWNGNEVSICSSHQNMYQSLLNQKSMWLPLKILMALQTPLWKLTCWSLVLIFSTAIKSTNLTTFNSSVLFVNNCQLLNIIHTYTERSNIRPFSWSKIKMSYNN